MRDSQEMAIRPLRAFAEVALGRQRSPQHDTGPFMMPYLRAANVKDGTLDLEDVKSMNFTPAEQKVFALRPGDILVSEGSGSLRSVGASAVWNAEVDGVVCFQNTLLRLRPRPSTDPRFLAWWCRHAFADGLFASIATGANIYHVSAERVRALPMTYLPLPHQRAIANYLDAETARIDALIAKKRRLVEVLRDRMWSSFGEAVFASNVHYVPLRRFLLQITDGPFGSSLTSSHYTDTGVRVVRLGNIGFASFKNSDQAFISYEHFAGLARHKVTEGDLLIAGLGDANNHVGRACVAPDLGDAIVKADCYCASVNRNRASAEFLALFLSSPQGAGHVALAARGTTRSRINLDIAKEIDVPLLALEQQRKVVEAARREQAAAGAVDMRLQEQITLLLEHRQALITAAVTGELAVPGVAA